MAAHVLEVGLRGTRNYVQGSQILARTAELVAAGPAGPYELITAKFTRITEQGVIAVIGEGDAGDAPEIGVAQFGSADGRVAVRFHEMPGPKAPPIAENDRYTSGLVTDAAGGGEATFAINGTFESYLAAVIEFVKAAHAKRGDDVVDIWFTALMGAHLPLEPRYPTVGTFRLTPKIERIVGGRLQTLGLVDTDAAGAPPQFQICFSCVVRA
jgi:hypothetical protein